MITEDKVIEFFCIADDFCKFFDAQMAKYSFKAERKRPTMIWQPHNKGI